MIWFIIAVGVAFGLTLIFALCHIAKSSDEKIQSTIPKRVQLRYVGIQPGHAHIKPQPLFNVVSGDYIHGSTITLKTAFRNGLIVEIVE